MNVTERLSPHWSSRGDRPITAIVIHDTRGETAESAVSWFQHPESKVSAHYVVGRDGAVYRCVPDALAAWHAGASVLHGEAELNRTSLGIELVDLLDTDAYPVPQLDAAIMLTAQLAREYKIPLNRIVGHDQVCVPRGRKSDPGADFPWYRFLIAVGQGCL